MVLASRQKGVTSLPTLMHNHSGVECKYSLVKAIGSDYVPLKQRPFETKTAETNPLL